MSTICKTLYSCFMLCTHITRPQTNPPPPLFSWCPGYRLFYTPSREERYWVRSPMSGARSESFNLPEEVHELTKVHIIIRDTASLEPASVAPAPERDRVPTRVLVSHGRSAPPVLSPPPSVHSAGRREGGRDQGWSSSSASPSTSPSTSWAP